MQKTVNSQAIRPTQKPSFMNKSDIEKHTRTKSSSSNKAANFTFPDVVKEVTLDIGNQSPFKDHPLYSKSKDLASSFSYSDEDETEYEYEKLLFSKFLESKESEWITFMHDMNRITQEKLIDIVKIGETQKAIFANRVLSHYIGVWLILMGYKDSETKRRFIRTVQYIYPNQQDTVGQIAGIMYQKLFQGYLPESLQLQLLMELCKRGWQYLAFFVGKFIKTLKNYQNIKEEMFIKEITKAIKETK